METNRTQSLQTKTLIYQLMGDLIDATAKKDEELALVIIGRISQLLESL